MDNYATHNAPVVKAGLLKRTRWHVHLTPTSASWLNQVECFFALLTQRQLRRGVHRSVGELHAAITTFIDANDAEPQPFRWTRPPRTASPGSNGSACSTRSNPYLMR
jgi:hypothetical protein